MTDFAALEQTLDPIPTFAIEPPDRDSRSEIDRQAAFLALVARNPGVLVWAVPNGHNRGLKDRAKAKKEGLRAGVPDITVVWSGGVAFLEFKAARTRPDANQVELLNYLHGAGHRCAVVRSPEFALRLLSDWGAPVRAVR